MMGSSRLMRWLHCSLLQKSRDQRRVMCRAWALGFVVGLLMLVGPAQAQVWPTQPIIMVVPFAAGGPTDVVARVIAARLSEIFGQQVVVENVTGAGGMTGAARVAQAPPDGYQVLLGTVGTQAYKDPKSVVQGSSE